MKRLVFILLIFIFGCAPWMRVGGAYTSPYDQYSVDLPEKWMRLNTKEYLLITRDGVMLQHILIERIHVNDSLKHTKKQFRRGMLPHEAAEVILDNKSSNPDILNLKVIRNIPANVGGLRGFKAVYTHKNKDGLKFRTVFYGVMADEEFFGVAYTAALRHYFKQDLRTFEKLIASFRLNKAT